MDYYSVLGPIDPQIQNSEGRWVLGLGYLGKYKELIERSRSGDMTQAELNFLLNKFDPATLFLLEQAKAHSSDLIERWLCQYKFKDWDTRMTSGVEVTDDYKRKRAQDIAELLGDATEWNTHGRGIPLRTLESEKIRLKIRNFGEDPELNRAIREYYDLFVDYCGKVGVGMAIHTKKRLQSLGG